MTQLHASHEQASIGFVRVLLLPALLLWPVVSADLMPALSDSHKVLGLLVLTGALRHLERRSGAAWALTAATFALLRATARTPQMDALFDLLTPYATALSLSLALLGARR